MGGFLLWFIILCVIIGSRVSRENKKNQNRNLNRPPQPQMSQQPQLTDQDGNPIQFNIQMPDNMPEESAEEEAEATEKTEEN